jgi:hypothetical protein
MLGTYIVRLTVTDKAGNQQLASVSFTVIVLLCLLLLL